jgi:hypothetical protein
MNKERAVEILNGCAGVIAFDTAAKDRPAEVCLHGWMQAETIQALAWWLENCPSESWWRGDPHRERLQFNFQPPAADSSATELPSRNLLPICAWCTKVRDGEGNWEQLQIYVVRHADVAFTHSICPDCLERTIPR